MSELHPSLKGRAFVSVKQTSQLFSVSPRTIYRWTEMGYLPKPVKFGAGSKISGFPVAIVQALIDDIAAKIVPVPRPSPREAFAPIDFSGNETTPVPTDNQSTGTGAKN